MENARTITIKAIIDAPPEKVWRLWNHPDHIKQWNSASDDWHTPHAEVDLRPGGKFLWRMEAKDGSMGFDFSGTFTHIEHLKSIAYTLDDDRKVTVHFTEENGMTTVTEAFEAENLNPLELQQTGWQAILDHFKSYTESLPKPETVHFEILIHAPVEKVYQLMLADETYRQWTSVFCQGSYYEGTWEKGTKIVFIGPDAEGNKGGMVSFIRENIPNRFVSIEHRGILDKDVEIMSGAMVDSWAGCQENYAFSNENGATRLMVSLDVNQEWKGYFDETWPKALELLRQICEASFFNQ
jgi:uncharacterized protein YndB with AHSA1/START domain